MNNPKTSETSVVADEGSYVAPRNPVEAAVAAIWAQLLDVERVGIHENFLLLGGESLAAMQAASRLREQFACDVPMRSILVGSVADVAAEILASTSATAAEPSRT